MNNEKGFVYVATGDGYIEEANRSAVSLKKWHPDIKICLICEERDHVPLIFDEVIQLVSSEVSYSPIDKWHCIRCPFEKAIFLDSDTQVFGPIDSLFEILNQFDLALLPENKRGWDYRLDGVPPCFAEFNTGVIVFDNTDEVKSVFEKWTREYMRLRKEQNLTNDQPSFRSVVFYSDLRIAPIPSEFHFLGNSVNYIMWKANLIHGRGDLQKIEKMVNGSFGSRVYVPELGTFSGYSGKKNLIVQALRLLINTVKFIFKKPADVSDLNPNKWWK